jgi:hypothetical protein
VDLALALRGVQGAEGPLADEVRLRPMEERLEVFMRGGRGAASEVAQPKQGKKSKVVSIKVGAVHHLA